MPQHAFLFVLAASIALIAAGDVRAAADADGDRVDDEIDNCLGRANDQLDVDLDGFGNACDPDLDNDGLAGATDFLELTGRFGCRFGEACWDVGAQTADFDGDGTVGGADLLLFYAAFGSAPGPSGLACAGSPGCTAPPPLPGLPVVQVRERAEPLGRLNYLDFEAAFEECGSGCNLQVLAATYYGLRLDIGAFPSGFALYGFGPDASVLRSPVFGRPEGWDYLIEVTRYAPDGVVIQGLALDGRKSEQQPPIVIGNLLDAYAPYRGTGISTDIASGAGRAGGIVRDVEIREFTGYGIELGNSVGWTVENSSIHDIGCHQVDEPCGEALPEPNPWDAVRDDYNNPGRKTTGVGILLQGGTHGAVVQDNWVARVTKGGITVRVPKEYVCGDPESTRDISVLRNVVTDSHTGFTVNGGCHVTFTDNLAQGMRVTGSEHLAVGRGFSCGEEGHGGLWLRNTSIRNQGEGFRIGCDGDDLTLVDNLTWANCLGTTVATPSDLDLRGAAGGTGLVLQRHRHLGSSCSAAVRIQRRAAVLIDDSSLAGGLSWGMWLRDAQGVDIWASHLFSTNPPGSGDTGIYLDPLEPPQGVEVRTDTQIEGFEYEIGP